MNSKSPNTILIALATLVVVSACAQPTPQVIVKTVEVTRVVEQSAEPVIQTIVVTATPSEAPQPTKTPYSSPTPRPYWLTRKAEHAEQGGIGPVWSEPPKGATTAEHTLEPVRPTAEPTSVPAPPCDCSYNRYDCDDFRNHWDAQDCYEWCLERGAGDIHWLDDDQDGIACEWLDW